MNFVLGVLFILALRFEHELLQDVVVTCDDAAHMRHRKHPWRCRRSKGWGESGESPPNLEL